MTTGHTRPRTIVSPILDTLLAGDGGDDGLTYWKQILPETEIQYEGKTIAFTKNYLDDLEASFRDGALDQTPFLLADESNRHTMDPERFRAEAVDMKQYDELPEKLKAELAANPPKAGVKGLYAKLKFADANAVKAVKENPRLGVSARIREGITRADGKSFKRAIIHVLGTLDPRVTGMSGWTPALDLSEYADANLLDLSSASYAEVAVPDTLTKKVTKLEDGTYEFDFENLTEADIDDFDEDALDAFLDQTAGLDIGEGTGEQTPPAAPAAAPVAAAQTTTPDAPASTPEAQLSAQATRDIELANSAAAEALARARAAEARMADAEWQRTRDAYLRKGVPAFALDLAEPVLNRPDVLVLDLSNDGQEDVNLAEIVTGLIEALEGSIDVDVELGHTGAEQDNGDELKSTVKSFREQYGI